MISSEATRLTFAEVLAEIEKLAAAVFVPFDQLPVADADRAGRAAALIAVVRVMPEERAR